MSDLPSDTDRMTQLEQRQQRQEQAIAQIHEILLLTAQTLDRTARQQEINTQEIAELRAILRDRYGNGQTPQ
ncbi:MAG: hypothetical protein ACAF41_12425 [Leptolyngbya sp. BL-A-14]